MPFRDIFSFRNTAQSRFDSWPPAPQVRPIQAGKAGGFPSAFPDSGYPEDARPDPTLIIAFGATGEETLRLWLEKMNGEAGSRQENLRVLLITERTVAKFPANPVRVRVIELEQAATLFGKTAASAQALRSGPGVLFQQMVNYTRAREWLQESLLDLSDGIQVFIVGSLAEPAVGLLGEVLQLLRLLPSNLARKNPFSRVSALLTLQAQGAGSLTPDETFAAFREIGRFTFNGPHRMNVSLGMAPLVRSALLDHLFLVESHLDFHNNRENREINSPQVLAEALFTLIHASAKFLWENLINDLRLSGQIRQQTRQPVVHSLGIATLYLPLAHIKKYIAARLAYAALFGEKENEQEGILANQALPSPVPAITLAGRLLRNSAFQHPVFEWLLAANGPAYFSLVPYLGPEFVPVFQAQLAHSLTQILNTPPAHLAHLLDALQALDDHLSNMEIWFAESRPQDAKSPARMIFGSTLARWRETTQALMTNLRAWRDVLRSTSPETPASAAPNASGWRASRPAAANSWRSDSTTAKENLPVAPATIPQALRFSRQQAEAILSTISADHVYRSVISDTTGDLREIEAYYTGTIRPELKEFINQPSQAFTHVRERLEWWIQLSPNRQPEILLICWPTDADASTGYPPDKGCFRASQIQEFSQSILALAATQTITAESDLSGPWFARRIHHLADFVRRAADCYLAYDRDRTITNSALRRSYLISHDPTLSRALLKDVFPETPRFEINELSGGDATRFTALSLRLNIPAAAVFTLQDDYRQYYEKLPEILHLYPQEQTATIYEKRIWKNEHERILLATDLIPALAEPEWVTLFFQALFSGVIALQPGEDGISQRWQVSAVNDFPALALAPVGQDGLLQAFLRFTLEIPFAADVELNPQNHFHSTRRENYLRELTRLVKERAAQPDILKIRQLLDNDLQIWQKRGEHDPLAKSFSLLLAVEHAQPVFKGW